MLDLLLTFLTSHQLNRWVLLRPRHVELGDLFAPCARTAAPRRAVSSHGGAAPRRAVSSHVAGTGV
ncbi:hypothetical protein [Kitasatospora sp. NPDC094016]|uniref:hypothetical protein n=1 Tax=Kitasatospora sp. NPDC094016 TaxID=3154986 RepID=UPI00331DA82D